VELALQKIVVIMQCAIMKKITKFFGDFVILPGLFKHVKNWPTFLLDHFKLMRRRYQLQLRNGLIFEVRPGTTDKGIVVEIFLLDTYKQALEVIKSAAVVIDIGAQIGVFSLYAHQANPKARIFSFEPCSANFEMLKKNLTLNNADNIKPNPFAVTSETKEMKLYLSDSNTGMHSLHRQTGKFEVVQGLGINELFRRYNITRCDLMKLDCEGAEAEIIASIESANLLSTRAIIMEYHDRAAVPAMEAKLKQHGFHVEMYSHPILFACKR
jgi:FkbM family methyltransferase